MDLDTATVHRLELPMNGSYEIAGAVTSSLESALVVLEAADGTRGIGTADPVPGHPIPQDVDAIVDGLADDLLPAVLDAAPSTPNGLLGVLESVPGQENAGSAVEIAFLDLYCRRREQSLADFFGGALRSTERLNAWVGIDDPAAMAAEAREWRDRGFDALKMKIAGDPEPDVERVRAVHEAVGDGMQVRVDANEGYDDVEAAIEVARALEPFDLAHLEQPVPRSDEAGLARVTAATSVPVMADEPVFDAGDAFRLLKADAADRLKFKVLQSGGTVPVRRGLDVGAAAGLRSVVGHGFCTAPAASAELQLVATQESVFRPVETVGPLKIRDDPYDGGIDIENGGARVPDGPGLGVELSEDRLSEFVVETRDVA
jgi:L-alanine-DL-glutamate epimerase-like enolase superfamily enzyme